MKKLVDETTDDFTRTLLVAGIEHRPPAAGKAQLIVALGAGSALGLFSAKAFGWFGTGAGKVTLFGVALGVAGAVYEIAPLSGTDADAPRGKGTVLDERGELAQQPREITRHESTEPSTLTAPLLPAPALPAQTKGDESKSAALEPAALLEPSEPVADEAGASSPRSATPKSKASKRGAASKRASRSAVLGDQHTGPLSAVETPPAVGALAVAAVPAAHEAENVNERSRLDSEVRLVDEMHWAARRNDREALWRFVETYRLQFPDGQLKEEVAAFAARLDRPAAR